GLRATVDVALKDLLLRGLEPALALVAPVAGLSGTLAGTAHVELGQGLALQGSSAIALTGLELSGPLAGAAPVGVRRIARSGEATQGSEGAGKQELALAADDFLSIVYTGTSSAAASGDGAVTGTLTVDGAIARLSEIARAWVPIKEDVRLEGKL